MEAEMTQAERIRQSQLALARGMKILPGDLKIIGQIEDWTAREWVYVCALDGMDIKQFAEEKAEKLSVNYLKKRREEYFRKKYASAGTEKVPHDLQKTLEVMQKEVEKTCKESRQIRNAVVEMISKQNEPVHTEQEELKKLIKEKDDLIDQMQREIMLLRKEQNRQSPVSTGRTVQEQKSVPAILRFFRRPEGKRSTETRKFITQYMQDDRFSAEQIEFLLKCLEQGVRIKDIEKFAIPGLSVEVMERLKALCDKQSILAGKEAENV